MQRWSRRTAPTTDAGVGRGKSCSDARCPLCWSNALTLEDKTVSCSSFNHTASAKGSSGSGHWKGGNARAAGSSDPPDEWIFGAGSGEDVEIHKGKPPYDDDPGVATLTMVKIVCFFQHAGNKPIGGHHRPATDFVLGFEYVSAGLGHNAVRTG